MAQNSEIQWTDATWNFLAGCNVCSPGCTHCYAMRMAKRLEAMGQKKYAGTTKTVNGKAVWTGKINVDEKSMMLPFKWKKPQRVFVNSMSDLFHESVPFDVVDRAFAVMALTPHHTCQILTKRPERMAEYLTHKKKVNNHSYDLPDDGAWREWTAYDDVLRQVDDLRVKGHGRINGAMIGVGWPLPNVWLGASVEDQQRADERIPHLLRCPAAVRFLSVEPLIGPVSLTKKSADVAGANFPEGANTSRIDWVIVGAESGPGRRPMSLDWARSLREQCASAGVAFFMKQLEVDGKITGDMERFPDDLRAREFPKAMIESRVEAVI